MDKFEHDRRVIALLKSLDLAIGPLLRFDKATKHRVFLYFSYVKADVRRSVLAPMIKDSGVDFRLRRVPLFAFEERRVKKAGERYMQRHQVGEEWELRLQIKSFNPRFSTMPDEEFEIGLNNGNILTYSTPRHLNDLRKGEIDGADVAEALDETLSFMINMEGRKPCQKEKVYRSFQGVSSTSSDSSGTWQITSPTPSPTGRISSK